MGAADYPTLGEGHPDSSDSWGGIEQGGAPEGAIHLGAAEHSLQGSQSMVRVLLTSPVKVTDGLGQGRAVYSDRYTYGSVRCYFATLILTTIFRFVILENYVQKPFIFEG